MESNLAQVSVSQDELKHYISLTAVQTKGLKRYLKESEISEVNIEQQDHEDKFDACNVLALPSKKRKTVNKAKGVTETRLILSKTKRTQLEKIVEKKKKKQNVCILILILLFS